jgi:hypothetical protein
MFGSVLMFRSILRVVEVERNGKKRVEKGNSFLLLLFFGREFVVRCYPTYKNESKKKKRKEKKIANDKSSN